jgi:hypothetical protein
MLARVVQAGVGAVELAGEAVAGLGGLHFVAERAGAVCFSLVHDGGLVCVFSTRPDADEPVFGIALFEPVARVLPGRADAQVAATIVQAVAIGVIDKLRPGRLPDLGSGRGRIFNYIIIVRKAGRRLD